MVKAIPYLLVGAGLGAGIMWGLRGSSAPTVSMPIPQAKPLQCDESELTQARGRISQLETELATLRNAPSPTIAPSGAPSEAPSTERSDDTLSWRVSAVEKFVPLNDEQKARLREKYAKEKRGEEAESLDDIVGEESATYYRQQVQAAFKRVQDEEVDRDVVWLSRKLSLSQEQEASVRSIFQNVEAEVSTGKIHGSSGATPQERVRVMIASEAESAAADVEVFHDPGAAATTPTS